MQALSVDAFRFMQDLYDNNNKAWFDANRERYISAIREPMKYLARTLTGPVSLAVPTFSGKVKISRINNDIRFHHDKPPYKEHVWISFGDVTPDSPADLFCAIGKNGWVFGAGIASSKRKLMDPWRLNLIRHADIWLKYFDVLKIRSEMDLFLENPYKKQLYSDTPKELFEFVQARSAWIVSKPVACFEKSPEADFFRGLCLILPAFYFMNCVSGDLMEKLSAIGELIDPPSEDVEEVWQAVQQETRR